MALPNTSRIPGFYKLSLEQRRNQVAALCALSADQVAALDGTRGLPESVADKMIENVIGTFALPVGVGLNFVVDGVDYIVPMVVEEPSIVAAISNTASLARQGGGFVCEATAPEMIAQVQLVELADPQAAVERVREAIPRLMARGDELAADIVRFGGGMRGIELRLLEDSGDGGGTMLVVHLVVDCRDAMGANTVNTIAEGLAPELERLSQGRAVLRILSNLADRRLVRARCRIPLQSLGKGPQFPGQQVADNIVWAYRLAARDPYRAATHNKGILNGIDAVALATGNDWRAIEAGAHAFAARGGRYTSLTRYRVEDGQLLGEIELPMAVGTVGGATRSHPTVKACYQILGVQDASTLGKIMAAVGLAQNLGALRALASEGIQRGHMSLHARQVALAAGVPESQIDRVAAGMVARQDIRVETARELFAAEGG
ncbi:MAG: hydroxymethylglutaryl-CoA reductase, degradative [Pseudomonadota bacterium]